MRVVLLATDWNNTGSVEDQAVTLAEGLARYEVRSLIISTQVHGPLPEYAPPPPPRRAYHEKFPGYEIYRLPIRGVMTRRRLFFFYVRVGFLLLRRFLRFSIIQGIQLHTNGGLAAKLARLFGKKSVIKVVSTGNTGDLQLFSKMPMSSRLNRWARKAHAYVSLNDDVTRDLTHAGILRSRIVKISEGVDTTRYRPMGSVQERNAQRHAVGLGEHLLVLFVGRLCEENNLDVLLLAWQKAVLYSPQARLLLIGDGLLRQPLGSYAQQLGVDRTVKFLRSVEDTVPYYQACQLFVYPARAVTVATTVLEAMACGAPVISTRIAGTTDLMVDQETGLLCDPGDVRALATAMVYLMENSSDASAMGRAARERAQKYFSIEAYAGKYLALYQQLAGR